MIAVAPNARENYRAAFRDGDELLARFGITTRLRLAHFLAQVLHESGDGKVLFENLSYSSPGRLMEIFGVGRHSAAIRQDEVAGLLRNPQALAERVYGLGNPAKARELGNTRTGDGYRYRGGGALQTTGGGAYRRMGERIGVELHRHPELIVEPEHALKPAVFEWDDGNLNALADKNDIRRITRRINGGYNGIADRQETFDRLWALLGRGDSPAWKAGAADPDTTWLQNSLNRLGAEPPLRADGKYGPATTAAVKAFQKLAGLKVDGVAGEVTRAAIRLRLSVLR